MSGIKWWRSCLKNNRDSYTVFFFFRIGILSFIIEKLKNNFLSEVSHLLVDASTRKNDLRERVRAAKVRLDLTKIRAPSEGRVVGSSVHTEGGVIAPGAVLMSIVPNNERLIVDARVALKDIDQIAEGQNAEIRFSSFIST